MASDSLEVPAAKRPATRYVVPPVIAKAIVSIQIGLKPLERSSENEEFNSKFTPLSEVMTQALELLGAYGIGVTQSPITDNQGHAALETTLLHKSGVGFTRTTKLAMSQVNPQSHASAITYTRRYALMSILGLTSEDDDDDGNTAANKQLKPTEAQKIELKSMLVQLKFPSDAIAQEMWKARTRDQATLMIENYRKLVSQKVRDIEGAAAATKIEVQGSESPIEDESSPIATLKARIKALNLASRSIENKFVVSCTDKPLFKVTKPEDFKALDLGLTAVESGVRLLPSEWFAPTGDKEHKLVEEPVA